MSAKKRTNGRTRLLVKNRFLKGKRASEIARELGVSRQAVHQHLESLRAAGELEKAS